MCGAGLHTALGVLCAQVVVRIRFGFRFVEIKVHVTFVFLKQKQNLQYFNLE